MKAYYNLDAIGDTLLVQMTDLNKQKHLWVRKNDVTYFYDKESQERVGYNIFNFSQYGEVSGKGEITVTDEIIESINKAFKKNNIDASL
ncbi:DUF4479 domain-containing protein [Alteribacter aurantiacus]|uniref:DUF4479 domain-containing protein n=1 Tax=Alteribacter aurantiacus TaxID=254410 RepID=UPI000414D823|nr:DUF4479 domain-containing protein [Alteribacter aurantiacus]